MKRILIVCAALLLCGVAAARGRGVHRVASCNIRVALPQDEEGGNGWSARKYVCERVMKRCKADIYCLQEVTIGQYEDMCRMFPGISSSATRAPRRMPCPTGSTTVSPRTS